MPSFSYDPTSRRYRSVETGQYVTSKQVRAAVDAVIDGYQSDLVQLATRLQAGELSLAEWQMQTAQALKALHIATAVAAGGGFANMSQADYGFVGSLVKKQYQYLRDFADDIATGKQLVTSSGFLPRVKLYAQAARGSYSAMEQRREKYAGMRQSRRVLGAGDSCDDCLRFASMGWRPIGELPVTGQDSVCRVNCRCELQYK